jgi:hypothetical protein
MICVPFFTITKTAKIVLDYLECKIMNGQGHAPNRVFQRGIVGAPVGVRRREMVRKRRKIGGFRRGYLGSYVEE